MQAILTTKQYRQSLKILTALIIVSTVIDILFGLIHGWHFHYAASKMLFSIIEKVFSSGFVIYLLFKWRDKYAYIFPTFAFCGQVLLSVYGIYTFTSAFMFAAKAGLDWETLVPSMTLEYVTFFLGLSCAVPGTIITIRLFKDYFARENRIKTMSDNDLIKDLFESIDLVKRYETSQSKEEREISDKAGANGAWDTNELKRRIPRLKQLYLDLASTDSATKEAAAREIGTIYRQKLET